MAFLKIHDFIYNPHYLLHWDHLSGNPAAVGLLEQNQDKIDWKRLSRNENAVHILEKNLDLNWSFYHWNNNSKN